MYLFIYLFYECIYLFIYHLVILYFIIYLFIYFIFIYLFYLYVYIHSYILFVYLFDDWTLCNNMKLNPTKCMYMDVSFMKDPQVLPPLRLCNQNLQTADVVKILGIKIAKDLTWDTHIGDVLVAGCLCWPGSKDLDWV